MATWIERDFGTVRMESNSMMYTMYVDVCEGEGGERERERKKA